MKSKTILYVLITLLLVAGVAWAATSGDLAINWWNVSSGGGTMTNDDYTLLGTAGQTEAGAVLSSGDYQLSGGYWPGGGAESLDHKVYLPSVIGS